MHLNSVLEDLIARGFKAETILDVGANSAGWSTSVKSIFKDSDFVMIEPQLEMAVHLKKFCNENKGSKYFLCGAGSENSILTLTIWNDKLGSSFIPSKEEIFDYATEKRDVEVKTINSLIKENKIPIPNLVKLDVQGFEIDALIGASDLFGKTEIFILEVSLFEFEGMPVFEEVINFMSKNGYAVYDFGGFLRRPYDGALGQCDVIFARKDGFLTSYKQWR